MLELLDLSPCETLNEAKYLIKLKVLSDARVRDQLNSLIKTAVDDVYVEEAPIFIGSLSSS